MPCAALLARPASTLRIVVTLAGGQALVHLALTVTAGHTGHAGTAGHAHAGRHRLGARRDAAGSALETLQSGQVGTAPGGLTAGGLAGHLLDHAPMFLAHAAAAALVGLWLAVGERALWALLALAVRTVLAPLVAVLVLATPAPATASAVAHLHPHHRTALQRVARSVVRRGPPALLAA